MICSGLFKEPSIMGYYRYDGIGLIISVVVVCGPISFIPIYVFYRFCKEDGTLKEVSSTQFNLLNPFGLHPTTDHFPNSSDGSKSPR